MFVFKVCEVLRFYTSKIILLNYYSTLDFADLMTYDLHGPWESVTGINAPLYRSTSETGVQATLNVVSDFCTVA